MSPSIRPAAVEDAPEIAALHVRAWRAAYRGHVPPEILDNLSVAEREEGWRERFGDAGEARAWVAEREGRLLGFAYGGPCRDEDLGPGAGEVYALYVEPGVIGTGVGRALFARAVDDMRARRLEPIVVWVLETNSRARRFYEAAGLRLDGATKVEDYDGAPMHEVRYRLERNSIP